MAVFYEGAEPGEVRAHQGSRSRNGPRAAVAKCRATSHWRNRPKPDDRLPSVSIADAGEGQHDELPRPSCPCPGNQARRSLSVQGTLQHGRERCPPVFADSTTRSSALSRRLPAAAAAEHVSTAWGSPSCDGITPVKARRSRPIDILAPVEAADRPRHGGVARSNARPPRFFPKGSSHTSAKRRGHSHQALRVQDKGADPHVPARGSPGTARPLGAGSRPANTAPRVSRSTVARSAASKRR